MKIKNKAMSQIHNGNHTIIRAMLISIIVLLVPQQNYAQSGLSSIDFSESETFILPNKLKEISGIATTNDGRIFAHNDELGVVYQIDFLNKRIVKSFSIGIVVPYKDFEDIAIADSKFFLLTSSGDIYEFREPEQNKYSDYIKYSSVFSPKFNFEGLCYDPENKSLLLAAKEYPGKDYKGNRTVYSFNLIKKQFDPKPRFVIPLNKLKKKYKIKDFLSTGIEYNEKSKTFFIISSNQKSIIEVSPHGEILDGMLLPAKNHIQPEGITFDNNGNLLISDEGRSKKGMITRYRYQNK